MVNHPRDVIPRGIFRMRVPCLSCVHRAAVIEESFVSHRREVIVLELAHKIPPVSAVKHPQPFAGFDHGKREQIRAFVEIRRARLELPVDAVLRRIEADTVFPFKGFVDSDAELTLVGEEQLRIAPALAHRNRYNRFFREFVEGEAAVGTVLEYLTAVSGCLFSALEHRRLESRVGREYCSLAEPGNVVFVDDRASGGDMGL